MTTNVGNPVTKFSVDSTSGNLSRGVELWSAQVLEFKAWLDAMPDADLEAPPFGYSSDDVALLKSAFNDLSQLANAYKGLAEITPARDLGVFSRRLAGLLIPA